MRQLFRSHDVSRGLARVSHTLEGEEGEGSRIFDVSWALPTFLSRLKVSGQQGSGSYDMTRGLAHVSLMLEGEWGVGKWIL